LSSHRNTSDLSSKQRQRFQETGPVKPLAFVSTLGMTEPCAFKVKEALEAKGREVIIARKTG
jgi:uncharacterized protein (UPF0261 family)